MATRTREKRSLIKPLLGAVGAFAGAALFGAVIASALTFSDLRFKPPLQNPFASSRSVQ